MCRTLVAAVLLLLAGCENRNCLQWGQPVMTMMTILVGNQITIIPQWIPNCAKYEEVPAK